MAGTLIVNEQATWLPPGWIFDDVLGEVALELQSTEPALAARILDARTDRSVGYLDCTSLGPAALRHLLQGTERVLEKRLLAGPDNFHQPSAFTGYVRSLRDLVALLQKDPRASGA